jgi:protein-S-isoprenylcysteine O-methyltransferase Ste14
LVSFRRGRVFTIQTPERGAMNPSSARVVVFAAAIGLGLIRAWHTLRRRRRPSATTLVGGWQEILVVVAVLIGFVTPAMWASVHWLGSGDAALHAAPFAAGALLLSASLWLFHLTHLDLGANWSSRLAIQEFHALVTNGLYGRVRHPMYLSFLIYGIGQALVIPNWIVASASLIGTVLLIAMRIGPEEAMMRARFGREYEAYAARTRRLIPGVW